MTYLKNEFLKTACFFCMFLVVNIVLICSRPLNACARDIAYMDFLMVFIWMVFTLVDHARWKARYGKVVEALQEDGNLDFSMPDSSSSFEAGLMKDMIRVKNAQAEKQVDEARELLEEVNDYITKWVHEIKMPIAVCELIADKMEEEMDSEGCGRISEELRVEIERMKFLINQVLYTSRSSSCSESLQVAETSIEKVVREVVKRNATLFISKDIQLRLENLEFNVMTDEKWLAYIVDQLLNNACKYVDKGGSIQVRAEEDEKMVRLIVRDNGMGISPKDIKRIFDKGFTGENGRRMSKSTGMGLYLSRKMANRLNHDLVVNSEEGSYAEFTLCMYKLADYFNIT